MDIRYGQVARSCENCNEHFGFRKESGMSWLAELLPTSLEGSYDLKLITLDQYEPKLNCPL
jgi:hypothetical protein